MMHPLHILFLGVCLYCVSASALAIALRHDGQLQHAIIDHGTLHIRSTDQPDRSRRHPRKKSAITKPDKGLIKQGSNSRLPPRISTKKYTEPLPAEEEWVKNQADASMSKGERIRVINCIDAELAKYSKTIRFGKHKELGKTLEGIAWFNELVQKCGGPEGYMLPQAWLSPEEADAIRREAESSMPAKRRSEIAECINKELARHTDGDMKFPFNHGHLGKTQTGVNWFNSLVGRCGGPRAYRLPQVWTPPGRRIPYIDVGEEGDRRLENIKGCQPVPRKAKRKKGAKGPGKPIDVDAQPVNEFSLFDLDTSGGPCSPTWTERLPDAGTVFSNVKSYFLKPGTVGPGGVGGGPGSPLARPFR